MITNGMKTNLILILDNIRSVHNVGSIFRTADGAGVSKIFLCGTTPSPIDRFGRKRNDFAKVSLGAEESVEWKYFETTQEAVFFAKEKGSEIVSLEQDSRSVSYGEYVPKENVALVLGTEVSGLGEEIKNLSDVIIEIPMRGKKESLNVSVASGVAMYEILKNKKSA